MIAPHPPPGQIFNPRAIPFPRRPREYARLKLAAQQAFQSRETLDQGAELNAQAAALWRVMTRTQQQVGTAYFQDLDRREREAAACPNAQCGRPLSEVELRLARRHGICSQCGPGIDGAEYLAEGDHQ